MRLACLCLLLLFGTAPIASAQLINIESRRMHTDSVRSVFRGDLSSAFTDNDGTNIFTLRGSVSTQLKSKDLNSVYFFTGDYNLIRSGSRDIINNWFFHLRYNQALYNRLADFRILEQLKLDLPLGQKVSVFALVDYFYDSITPKDRKQYYSINSFGLSLRL